MCFTQVSETDWMDSATQAKAAEKADQMLQLIGYPDWLTDASQVQNKLTVLETTLTKVDSYYLTAPATSEQDHFMNMISTGHWAAIQDLKTLRWVNLWFCHLHKDHHHHHLHKDHHRDLHDDQLQIFFREEPQRDIWLMHPAIVNAWYSPNHNTISMMMMVMTLIFCEPNNNKLETFEDAL